MKSDNTSNSKATNSFSDCHRTQNKNQSAQVSETNSDQDSANAKYVTAGDNRERKDGPGGN